MATGTLGNHVDHFQHHRIDLGSVNLRNYCTDLLNLLHVNKLYIRQAILSLFYVDWSKKKIIIKKKDRVIVVNTNVFLKFARRFFFSI